ncbi:hypothetical protein DPMN_148994 [Dreissena polymorpha]|uniref:Uncharacterized protein n=1 Tax=Dreissena polymorpha TaxID=45954 RepID=A0A9D4FAY3_DREPO|nr:hypothetical protein DPMN_148994 [Dreissena polymorpha]
MWKAAQLIVFALIFDQGQSAIDDVFRQVMEKNDGKKYSDMMRSLPSGAQALIDANVVQSDWCRYKMKDSNRRLVKLNYDMVIDERTYFQTETKEKIVSVVTSTKKKLTSAKKTNLQQYLPHHQVNLILRLHYVRNQSVSQHSYLIYFTGLTKFGTHFAKPFFVFRNHAFDSPTRLGKRQRKSKRSDISRPHEVARGCLPIRSHHKCDESKILPTTRLGITLEDTMKV